MVGADQSTEQGLGGTSHLFIIWIDFFIQIFRSCVLVLNSG